MLSSFRQGRQSLIWTNTALTHATCWSDQHSAICPFKVNWRCPFYRIGSPQTYDVVGSLATFEDDLKAYIIADMATARKLHMHCDLLTTELSCIGLVMLSRGHSLLISRPKLHSNILPRQETTLSVVEDTCAGNDGVMKKPLGQVQCMSPSSLAPRSPYLSFKRSSCPVMYPASSHRFAGTRIDNCHRTLESTTDLRPLRSNCVPS